MKLLHWVFCMISGGHETVVCAKFADGREGRVCVFCGRSFRASKTITRGAREP